MVRDKGVHIHPYFRDEPAAEVDSLDAVEGVQDQSAVARDGHGEGGRGATGERLQKQQKVASCCCCCCCVGLCVRQCVVRVVSAVVQAAAVVGEAQDREAQRVAGVRPQRQL